MILLLFLFWACGSSDESGSGTTGSIAFRLRIQDELAVKDMQLMAQVSHEGIDCELHGIDTIEAYIHDHSEADFTHGICPTCARELYPELYEDDQ